MIPSERGLARRHPGATWRSLPGAALALALALPLAACEPPPAADGGGAAKGAGARSASSGAGAGKVDAPATPSVSAAAPPASSPGSAGPPKLAALEGPGPLVELPVDGHAAAVVSLPLGATGPRPVLIAAHGNFDRPEWQCEVWRGIAGGDFFILCPRGVPRPDSPGPADIRFTYKTNEALEKEIRAGLDALRARYPGYVDPGPVLYTGFSLGAIMGVSIAARDPALFPRAILVEGGHDKWTPGAAEAFGRGGGQRVLFACGQAGCVAAAKLRAALLEKASVATKVVQAKDVGHTYDGAVAGEVKAVFRWVVEGDARFGQPGAPAEEKR